MITMVELEPVRYIQMYMYNSCTCIHVMITMVELEPVRYIQMYMYAHVHAYM